MTTATSTATDYRAFGARVAGAAEVFLRGERPDDRDRFIDLLLDIARDTGVTFEGAVR